MYQNDTKKILEELKSKIEYLYNLQLSINICYDLKGIFILGQCRKISPLHYHIRLHLQLLEKFGIAYLKDVLTHEIAHCVTMELYKKAKPHGKEFKNVLSSISYNEKKQDYALYLSSFSNKKVTTHKYACECKEYHLSNIRHKRAMNGVLYKCLACKGVLRFVGK